MMRSHLGKRCSLSLIITLYVSIFMLQACETIYTSSIIMPKVIVPISTNTKGSQKQDHLTSIFDQYCEHKKFEIETHVEPRQGINSTSAARTDLRKCRSKWFYFAGLSSQQTDYKIELFLMQPWSLWGSGKQERFFCRETNDMFDFFKAKMTDNGLTFEPYARCQSR